MSYDHLLLFGFGGPLKPEDIIPFLKHVTEGRNIPEARIQAVAEQYKDIGGCSPYHQGVLELRELLVQNLSDKNCVLPVFIGYRHWHPFLQDTLKEISRRHLKKGLALILAPFRSPSSCKRYKDLLKSEIAGMDLEYDFIPHWGNHPKLIEACSKSLNTLYKDMDNERTKVIFSCHSIPSSMLAACSFCNYEKELHDAAAAIAEQNNLQNWDIAYHSRSGNPRDPWLGPDIADLISSLDKSKFDDVVIVPLGFICENAEILYDLDILARKSAEAAGLGYKRAATIHNHPDFIEMCSEVFRNHL